MLCVFQRAEGDNQEDAERHEARRRMVEEKCEALLEALRTSFQQKMDRTDHNLQVLHQLKTDKLKRQR